MQDHKAIRARPWGHKGKTMMSQGQDHNLFIQDYKFSLIASFSHGMFTKCFVLGNNPFLLAGGGSQIFGTSNKKDLTPPPPTCNCYKMFKVFVACGPKLYTTVALFTYKISLGCSTQKGKYRGLTIFIPPPRSQN